MSVETRDLKEERYAIIDYMGSWNIGSYIVASNKFAIVGEGFRPQVLERIKTILGAKLIVQRVLGENLVGCFVVANSYGVLVPQDIQEAEYQALKEALGDDIELGKLNIRRTKNALGNIIATNDSKAIISKAFYAQRVEEIIGDILNVELIPIDIKVSDAIASFIFFNSKGIVASPLLSDEEIDKIKSVLGFPESRVIVSTINMGNPIIRSGLVANDHGVLVGNRTSGVELTRIYNTLL